MDAKIARRPGISPGVNGVDGIPTARPVARFIIEEGFGQLGHGVATPPGQRQDEAGVR